LKPETPRDQAEGKSTEESEFRASSVEGITEALAELLSPSGAEALLIHIQQDYGIPRDQIPLRPREFAEGIRLMFGSGGETLLSAVSASLVRKMPSSTYLTEFIGALGQRPSSNNAGRTTALQSGV
jgi:hypothetical protein